MDKLTHYRTLVKNHCSAVAAYANQGRSAGVETVCVIDHERDHYLVVSLGWNHDRRVRITLLHARLRDDKIWIEEDDTEEGMANALVRVGVPHDDIVLAFQPPNLRHLTEFACA